VIDAKFLDDFCYVRDFEVSMDGAVRYVPRRVDNDTQDSRLGCLYELCIRFASATP
jgi:hypothetical protein